MNEKGAATAADGGALEGSPWRMFGVYVHVPFCRRRCAYCDFATAPAGRLSEREFGRRAAEYVTAVLAEARFWRGLRDELAYQPRTLYLGGGTPTLLPSADLWRLIGGLRAELGFEGADGSGEAGVKGFVEFTVEANPSDLDAERLDLLRAGGVTRLSIGIQSLRDELLERLGRDHDVDTARNAFRRARQAGFDNVSVDLIFALPGQTLDDWRQTLEDVALLGPEHVSCYGLDLDPHTLLGHEVATGKTALPPEEEQAEMYEYADAFLTARGYEHYEISNYARPGYESRHNLNYWQNGYYLGLGPSAHGHLPGCRWANVSGWRAFAGTFAAGALAKTATTALDAATGGADTDWAAILEAKPAAAAVERISRRREMEDTMMVGLRLDEGVSRPAFAARFGVSPEEAFVEAFEVLETLGVLERTGQRVRLSKGAWLTSNAVLRHFVG